MLHISLYLGQRKCLFYLSISQHVQPLFRHAKRLQQKMAKMYFFPLTVFIIYYIRKTSKLRRLQAQTIVCFLFMSLSTVTILEYFFFHTNSL